MRYRDDTPLFRRKALSSRLSGVSKGTAFALTPSKNLVRSLGSKLSFARDAIQSTIHCACLPAFVSLLFCLVFAFSMPAPGEPHRATLQRKVVWPLTQHRAKRMALALRDKPAVPIDALIRPTIERIADAVETLVLREPTAKWCVSRGVVSLPALRILPTAMGWQAMDAKSIRTAV